MVLICTEGDFSDGISSMHFPAISLIKTNTNTTPNKQPVAYIMNVAGKPSVSIQIGNVFNAMNEIICITIKLKARPNPRI